MESATECRELTAKQIMEMAGNGCTINTVKYFLRKFKIPPARRAGMCNLYGRDVYKKFIEWRLGQNADN